MTVATLKPDRAAAVRRALRTLVARHGFHGASMAAIAAEADVATGTAYVHYASKDEVVLAAYLELKQEMGAAAVARVDRDAAAPERFVQLWLGLHRFLAADPDRARFLVQVDASPYAATAHRMAMAIEGDPIMVEAARADLAERLLPLPFEVLYDLGLGPALRLAAADRRLGRGSLVMVAQACWRAISVA